MSTLDSQNIVFKTENLQLASAVSLYFSQIKVMHTRGDRACFYFLDRRDLRDGDETKVRELVTKFWNDELLVPALKYSSKIRILKSMAMDLMNR